MLGALLETILLILNAVAILNEKRFLKRCRKLMIQMGSTRLPLLALTILTKSFRLNRRPSWWYLPFVRLANVILLSSRFFNSSQSDCNYFRGARLNKKTLIKFVQSIFHNLYKLSSIKAIIHHSAFTVGWFASFIGDWSDFYYYFAKQQIFRSLLIFCLCL